MKFEFVDRIYNFEKYKSITGSKLISLEEYFLQRPLGFKKDFPSLLMIESLFQLGNWLIFISSEFTKIGFITMFFKMEILRCPSAGDKLLMNVNIESINQDKLIMSGTASIDNEIIFKGTRCFAHLVNLEDYYKPEDLQVRFSEIYRPWKEVREK